MANYILPIPFAESNYGRNASGSHKRILNLAGANENQAREMPENLILENAIVLDAIQYDILEDRKVEKIAYFDSVLSMVKNVKKRISDLNLNLENDNLLILGGDHTISMGTGAGLSQLINLNEVGLIYIDAHGDFNTPETSQSRSSTGMPVAINFGMGDERILNEFKKNHGILNKCVQIGLRYVDKEESRLLMENQDKVLTYSSLDVEDLGMKTILDNTLDFLSDCRYIWLSIDVDALDEVYFQPGETDDPVTAGLTPREILYIVNQVKKRTNLAVTEITQINDIGKNTAITVMANRIIENVLGLNEFRYNHK
jgi:arginase